MGSLRVAGMTGFSPVTVINHALFLIRILP
uniref:Uncharacterized protein n=1 Tax=Myoviridae sp. ctHFk21 TaxID=2823538 RepID=A0A8S5L5X6_9CAUD|nr:MAG TPA: hypothetical protein [Myoviridae sp. ctHFk21]DAR46920.1 MAG TPA: hypothetical protein [Caudoviricetes sp.]